jgi:hypothetical protein
MADSFSPVTQGSPGAASAVSQSNPFFATFWANEAALNFSTQRALAEDQAAQRDTNATYEYNRGVNQRAEPLRLTANQNSANSQGLAESGVLAKTQGVTQTQYAQKDARLQETRRNAVEKYQGKEADAITQNSLDTSKYVADAQAEGLRALEENPPKPEPGTTAANPGGGRTITGPAGPGGVVPYTEKTPGGFVRVGPAKPLPAVQPVQPPAVVAQQRQPNSATRKAAAKKVVAVG